MIHLAMSVPLFKSLLINEENSRAVIEKIIEFLKKLLKLGTLCILKSSTKYEDISSLYFWKNFRENCKYLSYHSRKMRPLFYQKNNKFVI